MTPKTVAQVCCLDCGAIVGVIKELEDPARPGFFSHLTDPPTMPKKCDCGAMLTRVEL